MGFRRFMGFTGFRGFIGLVGLREFRVYGSGMFGLLAWFACPGVSAQ